MVLGCSTKYYARRNKYKHLLPKDTKWIYPLSILKPSKGDGGMFNKKGKSILALMLIVGIIFTGCKGPSGSSGASESGEMADISASHYGGAVLKEPAREASEHIYSVSKIQKIDGFEKFDRKVTVYGLTLIIQKEISDDFVKKITKTMKSMFPKLEGEAAIKQEEVLQNMYRYKATLPVVQNEEAMEADQAKLMKEYSVCDIIMKTDSHQVNEVLEHLLHAITDVGLSYAYPSDWGFEKDSQVSVLMKQAIENKNYDISGYKGFPEEIKNRVLVQEYAYWAISSYWNLQEKYGVGDSEWKLNNKDVLSKSQADMIKLIDSTVKEIMVAPDVKVLSEF
jgi:hypothetical protein